jgi:hypothetical protein
VNLPPTGQIQDSHGIDGIGPADADEDAAMVIEPAAQGSVVIEHRFGG